MSLEQLERDVAELKQQMAGLLAQQQTGPKIIGPSPYSRWWENVKPMSEDELQLMEEQKPYTQYFRQTGAWPPQEWKPGDPIPEPEHWQ